MRALGVDIGGSGIKAAIIDTRTGEFLSERIRIPTPKPAKRREVVQVIADLILAHQWKTGPIGIGFPGVVQGGIIRTAANLHDSLIGCSVEKELGREITLINDADAAATAELFLGKGKAVPQASVLVITIGTGVGTALFVKQHLVPNLELGHLEFKGTTIEKYVSERTRKEKSLSWRNWAQRFGHVLDAYQFWLNPDLVLLGGGGVKKPELFMPYLKTKATIDFAQFGNRAGIIGAACAAIRA